MPLVPTISPARYIQELQHNFLFINRKKKITKTYTKILKIILLIWKYPTDYKNTAKFKTLAPGYYLVWLYFLILFYL